MKMAKKATLNVVTGELIIEDYEDTDLVNRLSNDIRKQRNDLLTQSDWTQLSDVTANNKSQWITYRQELRAVPEQNTFPYTVVWPTMPT